MLVPALNNAGEAVTLGNAADVDLLARLKLGDSQVAPDLQLGHVVQAELAQIAGGLHARLLEMTRHGLVDKLLCAVFRVGVKAHLNGVVTVRLGGLLLHDLAGAGLHHSHGHEAAVIGENLRHADFLAYDRFLHDVVTSCISC